MRYELFLWQKPTVRWRWIFGKARPLVGYLRTARTTKLVAMGNNSIATTQMKTIRLWEKISTTHDSTPLI